MRFVRIVYEEGNWIEGPVVSEDQNVIVVNDKMFGVCRISKSEDLVVEEYSTCPEDRLSEEDD